MGLWNIIHAILDYLLSLARLVRGSQQNTRNHIDSCSQVQNREFGWLSLDRKVHGENQPINDNTNSQQSGKLMREQQPILKKVKLLLLFNPVMDWIDTTHAMRLWTHRRSFKVGPIDPSTIISL